MTVMFPMAERITISQKRFQALVQAASDSPCVCAVPELREHDGVCISCWALRSRIRSIRSIIGKSGIGDDYFRGRLAALEGEQRLRAEQLPAAEAKVRAAREMDMRGEAPGEEGARR